MFGKISAVFDSVYILFPHSLVFLAFQGLPQKMEQNLTPRLFATYRKDRHFLVNHLILFSFVPATYFICVLLFYEREIVDSATLLACWTVGFGLAIDRLSSQIKRMLTYYDPYKMIKVYGKAAQNSIRTRREEEMIDWIDTLSEASLKALRKGSSSLANAAIDQLLSLGKNYLISAKTLSYQLEKESPETDSTSYTLFNLTKGLERIHQRAHRASEEAVCRNILTVLGKLAIYSAKFDFSIAGVPIHYLGKLAKEGDGEMHNHATATLLEVGRVFIEEVEIQHVDIREPFFSIISSIHEMTQKTFRENKTTSIKLLKQPFHVLLNLFDGEKMATHQDREEIVKKINQVLEELTALETVMSTIPPLSEETQESKEQIGQQEGS